MPLLNYTTTVAAAKTIGEIQKILVAAGARSIMATYNDAGVPIGLGFAVLTPAGPRSFSLPVNADAVEKVLDRDRVPWRYRTSEQAERVAWRILKDWMEAQLAIIRTEMVTLDQVMLPYMQTDNGVTVYELYREHQFALPAGDAA